MHLIHNKINNYIAIHDNHNEFLGFLYNQFNELTKEPDRLVFSNINNISDNKYSYYMAKISYTDLEYYYIEFSKLYDDINNSDKYIINTYQCIFKNYVYTDMYSSSGRKKYKHYIFLNDVLIEYNIKPFGIFGNIFFADRFTYDIKKLFKYNIKHVTGYHIQIGKDIYVVDIVHGLKLISNNNHVRSIENLPYSKEYYDGFNTPDIKLDDKIFDTKISNNNDTIFLSKIRNNENTNINDINTFNTKNVTKIDSIFKNCQSLVKFNIDEMNKKYEG